MFLYAFFYIKTLDRYELVGTIWNLDVLEYMLREVNRQRIAAWLKYKGNNGPDRFNQFCYGFAQALKDKIQSLIVYEAVCATHAKLTLWYETNIAKVGGSFALSMGRASSDAGLAAGKNAALHRGALGQPLQRISKS